VAHDIALSRVTHDLVFVPIADGGPGGVQRFDVLPIEGADRVAQQIKITLLAFYGEWFLDTTFGVPYLTDIFTKAPNMSAIENILRARIMAVPDVERIEAFAMEVNKGNRTLAVTFTASTALGAVEQTVLLGEAQ